MVAVELCVGTYVAYTHFLMPATETALKKPTAARIATPSVTLTFTPAPIPTETLTPTPIFAATPTPTATRVMIYTVTPTITQTPTETATPTPTSTLSPGGAVPPTQTTSPSANWFQVTGTQSYTTTNHIFVLFAQIKIGDTLAAGYRIQGTHQPSGLWFESELSCPDLCKASGPRIEPRPHCNEYCTPDWDEYYLPAAIQEGNVVFEAWPYETGRYDIRIVDAQGEPASEVFPVPIDENDRHWFFFIFSR